MAGHTPAPPSPTPCGRTRIATPTTRTPAAPPWAPAWETARRPPGSSGSPAAGTTTRAPPPGAPPYPAAPPPRDRPEARPGAALGVAALAEGCALGQGGGLAGPSALAELLRPALVRHRDDVRHAERAAVQHERRVHRCFTRRSMPWPAEPGSTE